MNPKLNASVSVVKLSENVLEFFKTNTRQQVRIRVYDDTIMNIVCDLDGEKTIQELTQKYNVNDMELNRLLHFLRERGILDNVEPQNDFERYDSFRRVIHFFSEYSSSHEDLVNMWNNIRKSVVLVIGLGAVGTWVACNLVQSGVESLIILDPDVVEITNIHRQIGFKEKDVGRKKVDALAEWLKRYNPNVNVKKCDKFLDEYTLQCFNGEDISLIINCADKPNVDTTSLWIGEYSMKRNIPHIVGGGYNLHLSLIGQTIIPGETACVKCFEKQLVEENVIDTTRVKKLAVKNRKVGSFAPMCSIIASMVGMEALKVLSRKVEPANINRRGEFNIYTMDISYKGFERRDDCEWCGKNGKYYNS